MPDMKAIDALLVAYADGELDEAAGAEVEAYVAVTPAAQRMLSAYRETASLLRAAFPETRYAPHNAPLSAPLVALLDAARNAPLDAPMDALGSAPADAQSGAPPDTQRDAQLLRVIPDRPRRGVRLPGYAWAVAASLVMGIVGYCAGAIWPGLIESERDRMLDEVAEYHSIYSRETVHLVEVPATQVEHLKAWLGKRVNGTLIIPDFKAAGLTFAGGRLVVLDGEPVAELMYTRENGLPIAFCVLSHPGKPDVVTVERRGALNLATWDDGSHSYIVVGEADRNMIGELATLAREQL